MSAQPLATNPGSGHVQTGTAGGAPAVVATAEPRTRLRRFGAEEELFLVARHDGTAVSQAGYVVARLAVACPPGDGRPGGSVVHEMAKQQIETNSRPHSELAELAQEVRDWRARAAEVAAEVGASIVASGTYPGNVCSDVMADVRYESMLERFGITAREHLTSGFHVHVEVDSRDEAVGVLDRIRVWLPTLLAMSANSPFWNGQDTGYASYRYPALGRWPSTGPTELLSSPEAYDALVESMVGSGVLLDRAMVYFDARISERYPTVEVRIADVCLDVRDAVLLAGLCRALVHTAAERWAQGVPPPQVPVALLRLASWRAAHDGLEGELLDPVTGHPRPAWDVVTDLIDDVRPALREYGDEGYVDAAARQLRLRGTGARRQREIYRSTGDLRDVLADLGRQTLG